MKKIILALFFSSFMNIPGQCQLLSTEDWLKDATTIPLDDADERKVFANSFNGLRIIFEPQLGTIIQSGNDRFISENFEALERIGIETNLFKGYVSLQTLFIYPSVVELDEQSLLRQNGNVIDPNGKIKVDYGFAVGFFIH